MEKHEFKELKERLLSTKKNGYDKLSAKLGRPWRHTVTITRRSWTPAKQSGCAPQR